MLYGPAPPTVAYNIEVSKNLNSKQNFTSE